MDVTSSTANNVARAILAVLDYSSTPDTRKSAVEFLESIKSGDVRVLANTSFLLVKKEWSSEIRLHAFKMLQHLVRLRWDELSPQECRELVNVSIELMSEVANACESWTLKSQSASIVAEIVRRYGPDLWQEIFTSLVSLSAQGPLHAELVLMTLRWLPEDIMVHNEDLEGARRRLLLRGLAQSLPEILPLLYNLLERHFGAAMNEAGQQHTELAKQHADVVIACLNAIIAYAEWAPVPDLARYEVLSGFLLTHKSVALPALGICLEAFTWTEGEATNRVCSLCGVVVLLAIQTNNVELREFVAKDLFSAVIRGLGMESNAVKSPDLVNLCREIFINLCDRDPAPRQVLLSLPCLTPSDLHAFEEAAAKTPRPSKQKQLMSSLLMLGTGSNLKALAAQKNLMVSPVSLKDRVYPQSRQKLKQMKVNQ